MKKKITLPFFFIILLIFMVYSNTFFSSWQFDDYPNILNNRSTYLNEFTIEKLRKSFSSDSDQSLLRAIPRFSFAINWYFGQDKVFGYHLVNIIIHCISSCALFLLIYHLIGTVYPQKKGKYDIAILSTLFWALHPIQIQAVTYIVQRMASMVAMFYILSMLFYVYGRKSFTTKAKFKYHFFILSIIFFVCAMFSKQNAAILPVSILMLEIIIFQNKWILKNQYRLCKVLFILFSCLLIFLIYFYPDLFFKLFLYEHRPFNSIQRCLTEFRVLVFYLSLIFFPITSRFSIEHYFHHSTSLFEPLSTLFCFLIIIILLSIGYYSRKKYPLLSFALLFYFLNHIIESSFIGLELAFEHRNYLPSIFLFIPIIIFMHSLISKNKKLEFVLSFLLCFLIIILGISTYSRNFVWRSLGGLWGDALSKSPESGRVLFNYTTLNLVVDGKHNDALKYFLASSNMGWHRNNRNKAVPFSKISRLLKSRGKYKSALDYARKAVVNDPESGRYMQDLLLLQIRNELWYAADLTSEILLGFDQSNADLLNYRGFVLLKRGDPQKALYYFRKSLNNDWLNKKSLVYIGYTLNILENYRQAGIVLNIANAYYPENADILYQLLNNSLDNKNEHSNYYCALILKKFTFVQIQNEMKNRQTNPFALRLNNTALIDCIIDNLSEI